MTDDILRALGERWGMGPLTFDAARSVRLCFDGTCVVQMTEDAESLWVSSAVGIWTGLEDAAVATRLLEANGALLRAGIGAFAMGEESADITLSQRLPRATLTTDTLAQDLLRFVEASQHWEAELRTPA